MVNVEFTREALMSAVKPTPQSIAPTLDSKLEPFWIKTAILTIGGRGPHYDAIERQAIAYLRTNNLWIETPYRHGGTIYLQCPGQYEITHLFLHAVLDFLRRGNKDGARMLQAKADKLKNALDVLDSDRSNYGFRMRMALAAVSPDPTLQGIRETIRVYEEEARSRDQYPANYTFEYCVKERFRNTTVFTCVLPMPSPAMVKAVACEIEKVLKTVNDTEAASAYDKICATTKSKDSEIARVLAV